MPCLFLSLIWLGVPPSANAANGTWLNTGAVDGSWGTTSNWAGGTVPGAISGTTNADIATFNTALGTFGTAGSPIIIDSGRNIKSLTFDTATGNYVIGTTGGNKLLLTSAGVTQIASTLTATNAQITINAPLEIQTANSSYAFTNNSANGTGAGAGTLTFGGAVTGATGASTLTLNGSNTNLNTIGGSISNGTGSGLAIVKSGAGTWVLGGTNSYTGATSVLAGTLSLTGSLTGATAILVTAGTLTESSAGSIGNAAASLAVGGTATLAGANGYTGATNVNVGGTLQLTGTTGVLSGTSGLTIAANGTFIDGDSTTATNNDGITNRVKAATTLTLNGGTFQLAAGSAGTHAQSFNVLASGAGLSTINTNAATGTNTLTFTAAAASNFTHAAGGLVNIATQTGFNVAFTNAPTANVVGTGTDAILIGATLNSTDFVKAAAGNVGVADYLATGTTTWTAGKNMDVTGSNGTAYTAANVNAVRFNTAGANTVTLAAGTNTMQGGILITSNVGANLSTITGGTLAGANGKDLLVVQNNTQGGLTIGSAIINNTSATGLTKLGVGNLTLSGLSTTAANNYTGTTLLGGGTTTITGGTTATPISLTGGLTIGAGAGSPTTSSLDLSNGSVTFGGALTVQTGTATANTITIGTGNTLRVNGAVAVGFNANGANTSTALNITGAGTFTVGAVGAPTNANFTVAIGGTNLVGNPSTLDMSGLTTFYANLGSGTFKIGESASGNTTTIPGSTVVLATNSTIVATTLSMDSATQNVMTLKLGSGTNEIDATTLTLFGNTLARSSGSIQFNTTTGSLKLRDLAGSGRATVDLVNTAGSSGTSFSGIIDLRGSSHSADLLISTLTIAHRTSGSTGSGSATPTFSFDNGTLDATTILVASHGSAVAGTSTGTLNLATTAGTTGASTIGTLTVATNASAAVAGNATGTVNIGGGTVAVTNNVILSANTSSVADTASGTITISGGSVTLNGGISMASAATGSTSTGVLTFSGGTTTLGGNITRANAGGTENTTITLSGGTLDMGGFSIGSASAPVGSGTGSLSWSTGTLKNLLELNGGTTALAKSAAGVLTLAGTNSFTGGVNFSGSGTLALGSKSALGTGTLNVTGTGSLQATTDLSGTNKVTNNVTIGGSFTINGSNNLELSGAITSSGSNSRTLTINNSGTTTLSGNLYLAEDNTTTGRTLTLNGTGATVISGNIRNNNFGNTVAAGLTINNAAAVVTLSGTNDYTGTTTLSAGTINVNSNSAFGASGSAVSLNGVTLDNTSGSTRTLSNAAYTLGAANIYTGTGGSTLDLGTGTMNLNGATRTWTVNGGTLKIGGVISGATGFGLTKTGVGTLVLSGANNYPGATTVSAGALLLGNGGSLAATAVGVTGATFGVTQNASGTSNSIGSTLVLNAASALTMADGFTSTLNVTGATTLAPASGAGTTLSFDIGGTTTAVDLLAITGAATVGAAKATIQISGVGSTVLTPGNYTIITATSGLNSNFTLGTPTVSVANQLHFLTLTGTATTEVIGVAAATTGSYWTGSQDSSWATLSGGTLSNLATDASGTTNAGAVPTGSTNVIFTANTASNLSTTLDQATAVNSLIFTGTGTSNTAGSGISSGTGGAASTLTINAGTSNGNAAGRGITVLPGSGANTISAPIVLGSSQTWTNYSSNTLTVSGAVSGSGASLTKAGTGQITLSGLSTTAANNYTGSTIIDQGTLAIATNDAALSGALVFGTSVGSTNTGTLDLSAASATFAGGLSVLTNSATANGISIGSGKSLTLTGSSNSNVLTIGGLTSSGFTTKLTVAGAGSMIINASTKNIVVAAGSVVGTSLDTETLDLSGLASFQATVANIYIARPTTTAGAATTGGGTGSLILSASNTINVTAGGVIAIGGTTTSAPAGATGSLKLGTSNAINSDNIIIGSSRTSASMAFNTGLTSPSVTLRGAVGGTARTNIYLGDQANVRGASSGAGGSTSTTGTLDLSLGSVDARIDSFVVGLGGGVTSNTRAQGSGAVTFGGAASSVDINTLVIAQNVNDNTASTSNPSATASTSTFTMNGGTLQVNTAFTIANDIDATNTTNGVQNLVGTFTLAGGTATIGANGSPVSVTLGKHVAAGNLGSSTATLTLNGGTLNVFGDITEGTVGAGTITSSVTLNGATLDLKGNKLGTSSGLIDTLNLQQGTLSNVSEINNGAGLTKTTAGTLILEGINTYTNGTTISAGTLQVGSGSTTGTLGSGTVTNNATLTFNRSNSYTVANTISGSGSVIQNGSGTTILTSASNNYGGTTLVSGGALQVGSAGTGTTGTGDVTVQSGTTILGTGTIKGTNFTAQSGSFTRPGDGIAAGDHGTLSFTPTVAGITTFASGSNVVLGLTTPNLTDGSFGGNAIGSPGYDAYLNTFSGLGSGSHDLLAFAGPSGSSLVFSGNLSVVPSNFTPHYGDIFKLLDWTTNVTANFGGFNVGTNYRDGSSDDGLQFDLPNLGTSGMLWDVSRFTSSGVVAVIPEPSRALLLALGLAGGLLHRRRRIVA